MVNPCDPRELIPFLRNMDKEMPIHSETTAKIKRSYSQGMPKDFMEYSAFVDNHFLNDNLAIIEEMQHRNPRHPIPKWFREYQLRYFQNHGILAHDNFFNSRLRDGYRVNLSPNLCEVRNVGVWGNLGQFVEHSKVLQAELATFSNGGSSDSVAVDQVVWNKVNGSATIGAVINQIAAQRTATATSGNYMMGVYSDNSGPDVKLGEMPSTAIPGTSTYTYQNLSADAVITTAQLWLALSNNDAAALWTRQSTGGTNEIAHFSPHTFGTLPDPAVETGLVNRAFTQKARGI